ncbi:hypothetical protein E2320_000853 [Naja naja]|nr:hypothetical protein E2320_000853 [Naja naja]
MFKGTWIILKFCKNREELNVTWYLRSSRCHHEAYINENEALTYLSYPDVEASALGDGQYIWNVTLVQCGQLHKLSVQELPLPKKLKHLPVKGTVQKREAPKEAEVKGDQEKGSIPPNQEAQKPSRQRRRTYRRPQKKVDVPKRKLEPITVAETWKDGPYVFILSITNPLPNWEVSIDIQMKHPEYIYISASEWPLKVFYMVMCIVRALRRVVADPPGLLLAGHSAHPVLDRRRHPAGHVGEGCLLCRISEHSKRGTIRWTMKLLKLRRNLVKLSLYRHFTNTLIFAVIGLAGTLDRRRFLAVPLFHHPAGDHVPLETLRQ